MTTHIEKGLSPKEATLKAMQEVSGPVIAIALILAAVFVPTVFIPGITGRLYQQFAITIAISVIFSVINALTLSPALASILLKPPSGKKSFLQPFYDGYNKVFGRFTDGYVGFTGILVRKAFRSTVLVLVFTVVAGLLARSFPGGFVPDEDNGYFLANVMLPDASSLERTDAVARRVEEIIGKAKGVEFVTTVTGYSLITGAFASNTAFLFVSLKPWEERKAKEEHAFALIQSLNAQLRREVPTKGVPAGDGSYRISGQKIFITWGEHDLTENIVHLVLARLPNAPEGTAGVSMFIAPKFHVNADGPLGARNDAHCIKREEKIGLHGSPTCVMVYGERDECIGTLLGEENKGLKNMFVMMNAARLDVGLQGVGVAEAAFQRALAYAQDRRQGRSARRQVRTDDSDL